MLKANEYSDSPRTLLADPQILYPERPTPALLSSCDTPGYPTKTISNEDDIFDRDFAKPTIYRLWAWAHPRLNPRLPRASAFDYSVIPGKAQPLKAQRLVTDSKTNRNNQYGSCTRLLVEDLGNRGP